jgi:hypothetical protein
MKTGAAGFNACPAVFPLLQVVANEYFDPVGRFSQAAWAKQLLMTLQASSSTSQRLALTRARRMPARKGLSKSVGTRSFNPVHVIDVGTDELPAHGSHNISVSVDNVQ